MKARDLKNILVPIKLWNKEYKIAFDFNAMAELDDVYGDFTQAFEDLQKGKHKLKVFRALLYSAIKPRYPDVTIESIGEELTPVLYDNEAMQNILGQIEKAINLAMPEPTEGEK